MDKSKARILLTAAVLVVSFGFFIGSNCKPAGTTGSSTTTTVRDTTPPSVSSVSPTNGATGVETNVTISAVFSEAIDSTTLTITLKAGSTTVTGSISYDSAAKKGTLTPSAALAFSTVYTATVVKGLKDTQGNATTSDYTWTFTTKSSPIPQFPLTAGMRWLYSAVTRYSVWVGWNPPSVEEFDGQRAVYVLDNTGLQGGKACFRILFAQIPGLKGVFTAEIKYLIQDGAGLQLWSGSSWKTILSPTSAEFENNALFLSFGPQFARKSKISKENVTVTAGTYNSATKISCEFNNLSGQYNTEDVDEKEYEYYADGVGAVKATWNYSYDNNDPQAADVGATGTVILLNANTGPIPTLTQEVEPNDNWTQVSPFAGIANVVVGKVKADDTGQIINDSNVEKTKLGSQIIHDWYAFTLTETRSTAINLTYNGKNVNDDVDLYLFLKASSSALTFKYKSTQTPGKDEEISSRLPAGTYYIGIQGWDTPGGSNEYYLSIR